MAGRLQLIEKQLNQQEMTKMVGGHRQFIALRRTLGLFQLGVIDRSIANQRINPDREVLNRMTDTL